MRCAACGTENAETARFCGSCGSRLTTTCPHCQADVAPGLRYCNTCGGPLPQPRGAEPDTPGAAGWSPSERRLVSVLFLDLEEFTALAESLDPEDVRNLQSRYFEMARSVVLRYGGTLEKFIGDAVMAVWGAIGAHEDDAERAVRAALELVGGVGRLRGSAPGHRLSARAAVATGEAVVTLGLDGQGMVAGDLVNTAARLQGAAPSGGVLVDETTRRVAAAAVTFEPSGTMGLKGKSRPVETWRATGLADATRGRGAGHSGPFVGRGTELAELVDLQRRTVVDGRSRLVSVTGIAGIGKSRLVWEFERALDAAPDNVALHVGRAPAYGEGITFAPLAEMVRRRARITEGTPSEIARRQLAATLAELVPDEHERSWIEPRLASLLDPGGHTAEDREELFAAWRRFFEHVAAWAPAVLVFEDVQWADQSLLDFIDHLATWSRRSPMLIVTLARPELHDRRPAWGATQRSFTAIHLEQLSDDAMTQLLAGLAPGLPPDAVRWILDRAGGVPLYAVDVVRMLLDRGQLHEQEGRFVLSATLDATGIPESLHSLVSARLDALPAEERSVLLSASILGRRFHPDALAAVTRLDPVTTRERADRLVHRELLSVDEELRSPGRGQLSFVQDVVRDVAYRTLSRRERRVLHLAAADHLTTLGDPDLVEAAGGHLFEAHRAAPDDPDAAAIAVRAVDALEQAATRSLALHAPGRALDNLTRALRLVTDDAARADLLADAATAARAAGRFDVAESHLRWLVDWRGRHGPPADAARARAQLASLLLATERHASALSDLEDALRGLAEPMEDAATVELAAQLARARVLIGDDAHGRDWADRTIAAATALGLDAVRVDASITRGSARMRLGDEVGGREDLRTAVADAERAGMIGAELRARNNLAWLIVADDPHGSLEMARRGMALASTAGIGDMELQLADVACAVALDTGDWDWALDAIEEMRDRPKAPAHRILLGSTEATIRGLRGDAEAGTTLDRLGPFEADLDPQVVASVDVARAWLAFVDGSLDDAQRAASTAADRSLGADQHAALVLAVRAALWARDAARVQEGITRLESLGQSGRAAVAAETTLRAGAAATSGHAAAGPLYDEAITTWRSLRLPMHLALSLAERDRFLPRGGSDGAGTVEAETIFEGLGATGLLRAIRPLTAQGGTGRRSRGR